MMPLAQQDRLRITFSVMVDNLEPDDVINELHSARVLTSTDVNNIKSGPYRQLKVETLIHLLRRKDAKAFCEFMKALEKTEQYHLYNLIINEN